MNLRKVHVGYSAIVSDDPITCTEGHLYENLQKKTALRFTTQPRCFFDIFLSLTTLMSKPTNLPLIACWRLLHSVQSWAETFIHHPPDGFSDCARSSVLWARLWLEWILQNQVSARNLELNKIIFRQIATTSWVAGYDSPTLFTILISRVECKWVSGGSRGKLKIAELETLDIRVL